MVGHRNRRAALVPAAVLAGVLALTGCGSSSTSGQGSAGSASGPGGSTGSAGSASGPSGAGLQQPSPGGSGAAAGSGRGASSTPPSRVLSVTGSSGQVYSVRVWASDVVTDCAAHSYGAKVPPFLTSHPCRSAHRVLATVPYQGRTAVLSEIDVSIPATGTDPYKNAAALAALERADGTGGLNDLLSEGARIPGVAGAIPFREAFEVYSQDTGVSIFDAWWQSGATKDQEPALVQLEMDLYLSSLASA